MEIVDFDQFDDELQRMQELMEEGKIALHDDSLKVSLGTLKLRKAVTVELGTSLKTCVDTMLARHFGCLLVVKEKKLCGIFTERDVLIRIAGQDLDLEQLVIDDFMTPGPTAFKRSDTLESAMRHMAAESCRHLAVVDDNRQPLSVLSIRDVIAYVVEFFPEDILNLPPHPIRVGTRHEYGG